MASESSSASPVAVVAAGAGARGAYEAGALSVLIPWLDAQGRRPTIFVGTSAGAINATLFAAVAGTADGPEKVLEVWRTLNARKVFRPAYVTAVTETLPAAIGQVLGLRHAHLDSLLDTAPLQETAADLMAQYRDALAENLHGDHPAVDALAVVATNDHSGTTVFVDTARPSLPTFDAKRDIGYEPVTISQEHVLASSAIPAFFPAVEVDGRYYSDGGVRLNVPLKPAIDLGAEHLAVVATHPDAYPPPGADPARKPDVVDGIVGILGSLLADRMVEDLHTLGLVNELVAGHPAPTRKRIDYVFVGPSTRHELGALTERVFHRGVLRMAWHHEFDLELIRLLIGRREIGGGDLLSYLLFDPGFMKQAIDLGIAHAKAVIAQADPWRV